MARILLLASAWTSFSFTTNIADDPSTATYFARVLYAVAAFVPDAFCRLVRSLLPTPTKTFRILARFVSGGMLLFVFLSFHPRFIQGVQDVGGIRAVLPGPLFVFFVVYLVIGLGLAFFEMWMGQKSLEGIDRNKLKYFFFGFLLAYISAGIHILAAYLRTEPLNHDILILAFAGLVFFGLWKPSRHFEELLRQTLAQSVFGAVIGVITGALVWLVGGRPATALWVFFAASATPLLFQKFRRRIFQLVDKLPLLRDKFVRPEEIEKETKLLSDTLSLNEWARRIVQSAGELFKVRSVNVLIRQQDINSFLIKGGTGLSMAEMSLLSIPFEGPTAMALESSRTAIHAEGFRSDPKNASLLDELQFVHARLAGPVFHKGILWAILNIGPKESGEMFNAVDLDALNKLLRAGENSLAAVLAGQDRRQQSAFWAHDLLRPFGPKGSFGALGNMLEGKMGSLPRSFREPMRLMEKDAQFVRGHLEFLLNASKPKKTASAPLADAFLLTERRFAKQAAEKKITWRVAPPTPEILVKASPELIEHRVLSNLVENAMRHCPQGGSVTLGHRRDGQWFWGFVSNTKSEPGEILVDNIFQPGVQLNPNKKGKAGLGLTIVKQTIEDFKGRVVIERTSGPETIISFSLPLTE